MPPPPVFAIRSLRWLALGALAMLACSSPDSVPPGSGNRASATDSGSTAPLVIEDAGPPDLDAAQGAACPSLAAAVHGVHLIMKVTWPGSIGTNPGSGTVNVWSRAKLTFAEGGAISSVSTPCGTVLPDVITTPIAGGAKVQPEFLPSVWESTSMPPFTGTGAQSSFDVNSKLHLQTSPALVGLTMADPMGAWPAANTIQAHDSDNDGHPGITATPRETAGYGLPPTSILQLSHADQLYIASRTTSTLGGIRNTCETQTGNAKIHSFDSHVIGCHIKGGGDCSAAEAQFVDDNRTVFSVSSATYEAKVMADSVTCADIRAALPAQ